MQLLIIQRNIKKRLKSKTPKGSARKPITHFHYPHTTVLPFSLILILDPYKLDLAIFSAAEEIYNLLLRETDSIVNAFKASLGL